MASCLLMTSCLTNKTVYVDKYVVPSITFPIFPALDRTVNKDGSWTIPKDDIDLLAEFYINYTTAVETYKHDKELFEKTKDTTHIE